MRRLHHRGFSIVNKRFPTETKEHRFRRPYSLSEEKTTSAAEYFNRRGRGRVQFVCALRTLTQPLNRSPPPQLSPPPHPHRGEGGLSHDRWSVVTPTGAKGEAERQNRSHLPSGLGRSAPPTHPPTSAPLLTRG